MKLIDAKIDQASNPVDTSEGKTTQLSDRETDELVIGLVGPVGAGVSTTAQLLKEKLFKDFGYEKVEIIKVSSLVEKKAQLDLTDNISEVERIEKLQAKGSELRKSHGDDVLAGLAVDEIVQNRAKYDGYRAKDAMQIIQPKRFAYIIDSLKHPNEVQTLRNVYGSVFWLFGVFAPEKIRKSRVSEKRLKQRDPEEIIRRDEEEGVSHGQKVRKAILQADFFIRNDKHNDTDLQKSVDRCLKLIFGTEVVTPTIAERGMYNAFAASMGSACLSRQVGAAILSQDGELIGSGRNDAPKYGGGLYDAEDEANDHRCYKWKTKICHNDKKKNKLYDDIFERLEPMFSSTLAPVTKAEVIAQLKKTDIKNLIEYSRAIHAEMDAVLSVARGNKKGLVGSTMYCTTYPCHNCARHIVASGIEAVYYVEPYPKSLATELHPDSICNEEKDSEKVVKFIQYDGVAPSNMLRLFEAREDRKKHGKAINRDPSKSQPISRSALDGYSHREKLVIHKFKQALSETKENQ